MYGIIFSGERLTPLNRNELDIHIQQIKNGINPKVSYHHLNEETGELTSYGVRGGVKSVILELGKIDGLQLKYEIHTGFDPRKTHTRLPAFFVNEF